MEHWDKLVGLFGPTGAVLFGMWYLDRKSPRPNEPKDDPASGLVKELRDQRDILIRIETLLEDRRK